MLRIKHPERRSSFYFQWILLSALLIGGIQMQVISLNTYDITVGLASVFQCNSQKQNASVTWSDNLNQSLENINGIKIRGNLLWFLPAESSHSGTYICLSREGNETWEMKFNISVEDESCPRMNREDVAQSTPEVSCVLEEIFQLDPKAEVTWLKNCSPMNKTIKSKILPMNRSSDDVGLYTCFVNFTFEGQNYSAAQTTEITSIPKDFVVTQPKVIYPIQETRTVILGESCNLTCKALVGKNGIDETLMYWLHNMETQSAPYYIIEEDNMKYMMCILHIQEIKAEHLNTNFTCVVEHPTGKDSGIVTLIPANQNQRYFWIVPGLVSLLILAVVGVYLFKVDLVLAYRDLCCFPVAVHADGKSYDAYVSYLHGNELSLSSTMSFALHSLPAVLEKRYGYKLFISGRDELPGEAVHDVVADRMNRSRRLIIVLTSHSFQSQTETNMKPLLLHNESTMKSDPSMSQIWGTYEQRVGLYDALVKEGLKVILVQVEDEVDESSLPESLRYISRTKGILRWRQDTSDSANRKFWKHLRYQMPRGQPKKSKQITELEEVF
ncbi:interleukin-1 receptor type 1 [Misgurnus anguillicaudatus]|uniref:interleukin-1 receptor type 1 n=1 Tax=Misgurnus anguillicaudatus TaxID=75329 RepID=UPI003CCFBD34